jgi:soluble lytic murein transglycosylase-like protein
MNPLVYVLGWALIHALWQGCLLVLLAVVCGLFLHRRSRHRVNGLALALCLLMPAATAWHFHRPVPADFRTARVSMMEGEVSGTGLPQPKPNSVPLLARLEASLQPHLPVLVALWALGASLMALRMGGGYALGLRWKRQALPASSEWQGVVDALARRMDISRSVRLLLSRRGNTPMTLGLWKPVVLIPAALLTSLPLDYLEALLAHELAHVHRLDYLSNLLQGIAETLLFFHPAVWWLSARIRAEREELADGLAAQSLGDPRRLALALNALDDVQPAFPHQLFPALAARGGPLFTRIQRLLSPQPAVRAHWGMLSLLLVPFAVLVLKATTPEAPPIGAPVEVVAQLDALAAKEGVDPQLLRSMVWVESGFNARAKSTKGATGLLQVMPETAQAFGAKDLNDPTQVMAAGAKYLRFLLDRYHGDVQKAVAAYNCGEKALDEGRITEEAVRYRTLVLEVLAAKAVQPEGPLAKGEVQGVIRGFGGQKTLQLRISSRGNMMLDILPSEGTKALGSIRVGTMPSEKPKAIAPWTESRPKIMIDASEAGTSLLIRCENPDTGWKGETRVLLDAPWKTFAFRMEPPKP